MSDDLQPSRHAGEAAALPDELTGIYRQLERDGMAWSSHVPDAAGLKDFVTTLATGSYPQSVPDMTKTEKEFTPMQLTNDFIEKPTDDRPAPNLVTVPKRPRSFIAPAAAVLLVILLAAVFVWRTHQHATTPEVGATTTSAATSDGLPAHATFTSSSLLAGGDVWQAGIVLTGAAATPTGGTGFVAHYTNAHWHVADMTSFPNIEITAIAMSSDNEGWAIGQTFANTQSGNIVEPGSLYHYTHGSWLKTGVMIPITVISATFQFTGQNHVWLLVSDGTQSALLHYDGAIWRTITTPATFGEIAMLSDTVGWFGGVQRLWHLQNGQFLNPYSIVGQGNKTFADLSFTAPDDGWALITETFAVNESDPPVSPQSTILHFDGNQWSPMPLPSHFMPSLDYYLYHLTMHTAHDGWGIIYMASQHNKPVDYTTQPGYLAHYLNGSWQLLQTPMGIFFMTIAMSTSSDGWAIGTRYTSTGMPDLNQAPVILRYQDGAWNVVG